MTKEEYFSVFASALCVAQPERDEIMRELRDHADDAAIAGNIENALGDPAAVAGRFNRVHIGLLHSRRRLFLTPVVVAVFSFIVSLLKPSYPLSATSLLSAWEGIAYYCAAAALVLLPLVGAWMIGKALARTDRSGKEFLILVFETLALTVAYQAIRSDFDSIIMMMGGVVTVVVCACVAMFAVIGTKPVFGSASIVSSRLYLEVLLTVFALVFGSFIIFGMTEAVFAPFDIAIERPPEGTVIRDVNDFFESGAGAYIPAGLFALTLIVRLGIRMRQYTSRAFSPSIAGICSIGFGIVVAVADSASLTIVACLCLIIFGSLLSFLNPNPRSVLITGSLMTLTIPSIQLFLGFLDPMSFDGFSRYLFIPLLYLPLALLGNALGLLIRFRRPLAASGR